MGWGRAVGRYIWAGEENTSSLDLLLRGVFFSPPLKHLVKRRFKGLGAASPGDVAVPSLVS